MSEDTNESVNIEELVDGWTVTSGRPERVDAPVQGTKPELMAYGTWNDIFVPAAMYDRVKEIWTWEGKIGDIATYFGVSQPYYQQAMAHLVRMGCIQTLRRGAAGVGSLIQLIRPPSVNLWESENTHVMATARDVVAQRLRDHDKRLDKIEAFLDALTRKATNGDSTGG